LEREIGGKTFKLGKSLGQAVQDQIPEVIARHLDVFAWTASDMPSTNLYFLCHRLTMDPKVRPVHQRRRKFNEERRQVIKEETKKLLSADHIREIQYPEWLANVVLVKKANGKWRMCVDFTDLNKACPKDLYPLPALTPWWRAPRAAECSASWMLFLDTTILRCIPGTNARQRS